MPKPEYPATGPALIGARIAVARARRDEALRRLAGDGAGGLRTGRPLDTMITSTRRAAVSDPSSAAMPGPDSALSQARPSQPASRIS